MFEHISDLPANGQISSVAWAVTYASLHIGFASTFNDMQALCGNCLRCTTASES